jgi:ATP/maltotriose-dependent transcriptional regulator MalT
MTYWLPLKLKSQVSSLNTVKTHLKNIYFKLEVNNRAKAITRANELELLE